MEPGDLLRRKKPKDTKELAAATRAGELALFLNHYISVNQVTGREYKCAEIMWLSDKTFTTASYNIFEVINESR